MNEWVRGRKGRGHGVGDISEADMVVKSVVAYIRIDEIEGLRPCMP